MQEMLNLKTVVKVLALLLLLSLASAKVLPPSGNNDTICNTEACKAVAKIFLDSIDPTVKPCDDFYKHACGKFIADNQLPDGVTSYEQIALTSEQVKKFLKEEIRKPIQNEELKPIKQLKTYYQSCIDEGALAKLNLEAFKPLLSKDNGHGGWPLIQKNYSGENYDPMLAEAAMKRVFGLNGALFEGKVHRDVLNSSRNAFVLGVPKMSLSLSDYGDEDELEFYFSFMKKVARIFIDDAGIDIDDEELEEKAVDAIKFELGIVDFLQQSDLRSSLFEEPDYSEHDKDMGVGNFTRTELFLVSLDLLEFYFPDLNVRAYFEDIYKDVADGFDFPSDEIVIYAESGYMKFLSHYLSRTQVKDQANYHHWKFMTEYAYAGPRKVYGNILDYFYRSDFCRDKALEALDWAQSRIYVEKKFTQEAREEANDMVYNLKASFKDLVNKSVWLKDKEVANEKVDSMIQNLGYPDWIMDDKKFVDFHKKLGPMKPDRFLENALAVKVWKQRQNLYEMIKARPRTRFVTTPSLANADYTASLNSITFPAAILQSPFFGVNHPRYINYGSIGSLMGHEVTHGFDNDGRQYDKDGNLVQWWSEESIEAFERLAECFVDQYDAFVIPELENEYHVSGLKTLGENIADNGGLKEAFNAYKVQQAKATEKDPLLPGLEAYSRDQMFFVAFAKTWCQLQSPQGFLDYVNDNEHAPGRYRILGSAMNSGEFSKAFGCPKGSAMNPIHKCVLW